MESIATTGRQARMMDKLGKELAELTRSGSAPNQLPTDVLPPEMISKPRRDQTRHPDGRPRMQYGERFMGANSIQLRRDAAARGTTETRYATTDRVNWVNRAHGRGSQEPLRGVNPVTNQAPKGVPVAAFRATAVRTVHHQDGEGFGPGGEQAGKVQVKAGDPMYDASGQQVEDSREMRSTYEVYSVTDLNVTGLRPRTPPNASERALAQQDEDFKELCKQKGEPERVPDDDERVSLVVSQQLGNLTNDVQYCKGVQVVEGADVNDARFRVKAGQPLIEIPPPHKFETAHHQATSVVHACAHAELYAAAKSRADRAAESGIPDEQAEARVAAYHMRSDRRANNEEYSRCELAATYATVNRVTAIPATYVPPASTTDEKQVERWSQTLAQPGGMASVSRDINTIEASFSADRDTRRGDLARERRAERDQQRAEEHRSDVERKAVSPGGDPAVVLPAARPAPASPTPDAPDRAPEQPER